MKSHDELVLLVFKDNEELVFHHVLILTHRKPFVPCVLLLCEYSRYEALLEDWREFWCFTFSKQICLDTENIFISKLLLKLFDLFGIRSSLPSMLSTKTVSHWEATASDGL